MLTGTLPLRLFQHRLLLCGFVLVTLTDGPGDMLPQPAGQRTNELRVGRLHLWAAQNQFPLVWKGGLRVFPAWLPSVTRGWLSCRKPVSPRFLFYSMSCIFPKQGSCLPPAGIYLLAMMGPSPTSCPQQGR